MQRAAASARCEGCLTARNCFVNSLDPETARWLTGQIERTFPVPKGTRIFSQGQPLEFFYIILVGTVKTVLVDDTGTEQTIRFLFPGEILGLSALESLKHTCSAEAMEDTRLCRFSYRHLSAVNHFTAMLGRQIERSLSKELNALQTHMLLLLHSDALHRVTQFLLQCSEHLRARGLIADDINLPMTRQEIGGYLGLAPETLSRVLTQLEDQGLILVQQRRIKLIDLNQLKDVVADKFVPATRPAQTPLRRAKCLKRDQVSVAQLQ